MKKLTFILAFLWAASFAYAQTSPETYLAQLPSTPKSACNTKPAEKASFEKLVRGLKDKMDKDVVQRKEELQVYIDANRDKIAASVIQRPGSVEKLTGKRGKMTKEERKARSEQMMRQYDVSPDSGKAAEKMQADPKLSEMVKQTKSIHDLQIEQKTLVEKIDARIAGVLKKFKTLDQNAAAMKAKDLDPLQRQLATMGGLVTSKDQSERMDQVGLKLKNSLSIYCETYSPQYVALLNEYLSAIKTSLPNYRRLEEIIAKTQLGQDKLSNATDGAHALQGVHAIEALRDYAAMLAKVYKYDLPYEY